MTQPRELTWFVMEVPPGPPRLGPENPRTGEDFSNVIGAIYHVGAYTCEQALSTLTETVKDPELDFTRVALSVFCDPEKIAYYTKLMMTMPLSATTVHLTRYYQDLRVDTREYCQGVADFFAHRDSQLEP